MTPETNHTKQPRRSWWGIAGDVFLNTLAVGGIICIALVACAFVFNITLRRFPRVRSPWCVLFRRTPSWSAMWSPSIARERYR